MSSAPLFTFVVAAYNVAPYIGRCLESLSAQTCDDFEVLAIDDHSTDNTAEVIKAAAAKDPRIQLVERSTNYGPHRVRMLGTEMAAGKWIIYVDGDDELDSHLLERLKPVLEGANAPDALRFKLQVKPEGIKPNSDNDAETQHIMAQAQQMADAYNACQRAMEGDDCLAVAFSDASDSDSECMIWSMVTFAVRATVAKKAFRAMTRTRIDRMEDAYEYLVLADCAHRIDFCDYTGLTYHWGRGITGFGRIDLPTFVRDMKAVRGAYDAIDSYAAEHPSAAVEAARDWMSVQMPIHVSTELILRLDGQARWCAFRDFARVWGTSCAISEIDRLEGEHLESLEAAIPQLAQEDADTAADSSARINAELEEFQSLRHIRDFLDLRSYAGVRTDEAATAAAERAAAVAKRLPDLLRQLRACPNEEISKWAKLAKKRLGIFCFYDRNGHAAKFIDAFLADLTKSLNRLVVVVNGKIDDESRAMFGKYTKHIIVRENVGLDAAAYKQALLAIGWEQLEKFDEVICLNDTVLGPVYPFSEMFDAMAVKPVDFWGITAYAGETLNNEEIPTHLQAYWHVYRRSLVSSPEFQRYWEEMPVYKDYAEVTRKHEMTFTRHFEDLGFTWDSYVPWRKYAGLSSYPLLYTPATLVREDHCPIFKRRSFFVDYSVYFDQTAGQPAIDLYDFIRDNTEYDENLIWDAILPSYNIDDIRKALQLSYVLPSTADNVEPEEPVRSAFVYHIYFMDLLDDTLHYIAQIPDETDLYITTTEDKVEQIKAAMAARGICKEVTFLPVQNRGRDVSALFVAAAPTVLSGKYDVIGFAHDKKSSQNQANGHHGTETKGFAYKLMENTLGSKQYACNILRLFAANPRLGLVAPPPPYHALYFAHTLPTDWGPNFEITKELLEDTLGLRVPLDPAKPSVSAIGSCYWFRVDALRPLFEHGWTYEDFLPEGQMGPDGTISHAIERSGGYVAQSQGYYPAWVMSDRYARIETTSLFYTTDALLDAIGPMRQGETLLANCASVRDAAMRGLTKDVVRRRAHLALKSFTKKYVQPLPEPIRTAAYNAAWAQVNLARHARNGIQHLMGK